MKRRYDETLTGALGAALLSLLLLIAPGCSGDDQADAGQSAHRRGQQHADHGDQQRADDHEETAGHGAADEHDEHQGAHEEGGHAEGTVGLSTAQIEAAGIEVQPAAAGEITRFLTLPAVAAPNTDAVTHVNPRAPGIVRAIYKQLGEHVEQGDLLAVIDSIELGQAVAGYVRAKALVEAAETTLEREGKLFEQRLETAERVLQGAVEVNRRIYEREQDLQQQAVSTIRPLLEADKALQNSVLAKDRQLTDLRAERDARLLGLEIDLIERRIGRAAARSSLLSLGLEPTLLVELEPGSALLAGSYEIRAPRGGIVSGRHITTGEFVDAATKLYTLEDLSRVWILASAFERQIQSVRTGQAGRVHLNAFPDQVFEGQVTLVGYEVDAESRALGVRIELDNDSFSDWPEQYPLRPGMFGSVDLVVSRYDARVVLPESAIVHEDAGDFVFVQTSPETFERRQIGLGPPSGDVVEVRAGLEPGEAVAVTGTFQLKSALRRGELGEGHSH